MGINTTIYSNHKLKLPTESNEIVELLKETWKDKIVIFDEIEVANENTIKDANSYKIFINPKFIDFELKKFNQITISTNFDLTINMRLHKKSICITPSGIGKYATNMIMEFMEEPFGIYKDEPEKFKNRKEDWNRFNLFLANITEELSGNKLLYLNDGKYEGIGDLAKNEKSIDEMIIEANKLNKPCLSQIEFIQNHTWIRDDGVRIIKDDIWIIKEV